jgi:hypothetical protein
MTTHRTQFLLLLLPAGLWLALAGGSRAQKATAEPAAALTVVMEDCKATRPGTLTSDTSVLRLMFTGLPREELVKRGTVEVDGQKYTLYLPKAKSYSVKNTKSSDSSMENNSTHLSVDQKGDGRLTETDGWFANLPLRLGDRMFDVVEIAAGGTRIVLRPSKSALRGVIVGRTCPPFSFKTADGKEVSRESLAGKPFLLDIWSFT